MLSVKIINVNFLILCNSYILFTIFSIFTVLENPQVQRSKSFLGNLYTNERNNSQNVFVFTLTLVEVICFFVLSFSFLIYVAFAEIRLIRLKPTRHPLSNLLYNLVYNDTFGIICRIVILPLIQPLLYIIHPLLYIILCYVMLDIIFERLNKNWCCSTLTLSR